MVYIDGMIGVFVGSRNEPIKDPHITVFKESDLTDALDFARVFLPGAACLVRYNSGVWKALHTREVAEIAAMPRRATTDSQKQDALADKILTDLHSLNTLVR